MGTTLTGTTPQDTYDSLIKVTDNGPLSGTAKYLSDGLGNDSALALSTSMVGINTTTPSLQGFNNELTISSGISGTKRTALNLQGSRTTSSTFASIGFYHQANFVAGVESSRGDADNSGTLEFFTSNAGSTGERMRITPAGNVGIGTSTPQGPLEVKGDTDYDSPKSIVITHAEPTVYSGFIGLRQEGLANSVMAFGTRSASVDYLDTLSLSNGNVGIGTTSPLLNLSVVGVSGAESASATPNGSISIGPTGANNQLLTLGFLNGVGNHTWLQSRNSNQALFYPLILNPSGGNVGIQNSAPDVLLAVGANTSTVNVPAMKIFRGGSTSHVTTYGYSGNAIVNAVGTDYVMQREGTEVARFTTAGLCFSGDFLAANALDDYEEGTFTATITPATSGTITSGATFTTWTYTKIGRQVTISGVFVVSSVGSPVGSNVVIGGLPFTIFNNNGAYGAFSAAYFTFATSADSAVAGRHSVNTTQLTLGVDASTVAASDEIYVTATYFV